MGITWQLKQSVYNFPEHETVYRALLTDAPRTKEHSFLCQVFLKEQCDSVGVHPVRRRAILYLQQDSAVARLKEGDEILVSACITPPTNNGNFDEFDYARYLMRKAISGTGFAASGEWTLLSVSHPSPSIGHTAHSYRERIVSLYRKLGFDGDELAVLSALTVGDKTELSESVRESYSVSGVSHVLALSGLHIGLLYALMFFCMKPVADRGFWGRCLRSFLLLILLWSFAFLVGFSPSVVRSVSMFSILALADLLGRKSLSLNTVAATAWLMLLCNPVWLFDVGFQLSFVAVTSILVIQKPLYHLLSVENRIGRYIWGLMSVSIAAQIGTAPLILFYFSRFSTHFLLTNLVVVPLVTLILYAAIIMLLLSPWDWMQSVMSESVRFLLKELNSFIRWVEQLPYASIDGIWLYRLEVLGIYLVLLLFLYYLMNRHFKALLLSLSSLLLLLTFHATISWIERPQTSLVFYNVRGCPAVHCIEENGSSWLSYGDTLVDKKRMQRIATNYWNHQRLLPPIEVMADYQDTVFLRRQQMMYYHGRRICIVNDNRWRNKTAVSPLSIHYLYLCKGYDGHLRELTSLFVPSCIILDASLAEYRRQRFEKECEELGLDFISLSEKGSVRFLL